MKKVILNLITFISKYNIPLCLFGIYVFLTHTLEIQNCIVKWLIGFPCPGCGMTRAVFALMRFDFAQAFSYNPLVFFLPLILIGIAFQHLRIVQKILNSKWFSLGLVFLVIIVYILRFIYIYPNPPMDYSEHNLLSFFISLFH